MAGTKVERHLQGRGDRTGAGGRGVLLAAGALLLVGLIGLGSGRPLWEVGGLPGFVSPRSYAGDLVVVAIGLLAITPLVVSAWRGRQRGRRTADIEDEPPAPRRPWWMRVVGILVLAACLALCLLALRLLPDAGENVNRVRGRIPDPGSVPPQPPRNSAPPVHWWGYALLALVVVAGAVLAWRLRERPEPREEEAPEEPTELLAAVDLSLEEIELEPDPRLAVIRAYARMEGALGHEGLARRPSETPLEYLARALVSLHVGRGSIERLTALFQRAKFSQHEIDGSMKDEAVSALTALRDDLAGATA